MVSANWNPAMNPTLIHHPKRGPAGHPPVRLPLIAGAILLIVAGALSSCSTVHGFGRDVEKTGDAIEDAAT